MGRAPDQSVMHCWGLRSCRGQLGSSRGQFAWQCPMATKFGGKNPDQSVIHCLGQRSCRGHPGSTRGQIALWPPNLVSWGQVGVNLLGNALWPPNLVGRTPDQSVIHCLGQRSCRGHPGSTRGQIALWPPNLVRIPDQNAMHC